jgi:hypothetical protein
MHENLKFSAKVSMVFMKLTQYGSVKGEREKGKGFEYILYPFPLTLSPDHKENEKCLSEPYWKLTY